MSATDVVDESLYSRQLYVYGHEAQKKMATANVLIIGLNGLGIETAKNVVLAGVKSVSILDNTKVQLNDLGSQFYLREEDVGIKTRAEASYEQLSTLNPYVSVNIVTDEINEQLIRNYTTVVYINGSIDQQQQINDWCRQHDISFITSSAQGVLLSIFVDNGPSHTINDPDGNECLRGLVSHISNSNPAVITTSDETRHGLSSGMYISFEDIEGMEELNALPPQEIKVLSPYTFSIPVDSTSWNEFRGTHGYYNQVKVPYQVSYDPLRDVLTKPQQYFENDFMGDMVYLHAISLALDQYMKQNPSGASTLSTSHETIMAIVQATQEQLQQIDKDYTIIGDDSKHLSSMVYNIIRSSQTVLNPICAIGGGLVGQEILKSCSGKFTPMKQLFYYAAHEALPGLFTANATDVTTDASNDSTTTSVGDIHTITNEQLTKFTPKGTRYDDYIQAFGGDVVTKVSQQKVFLIGSGAIGCEMLKNWAMMGLATNASQGGQIILTDMDTIERSNLNRQFLFRSSDVGKLKSEAGAAAALVMNPALNITAQSLKVAEDTENVYDANFWLSLDGVYTALDNVDARLFVDRKCVEYKKPMVDSGTLGTAGNTQVVIPYKTESYGSTQDPPEENIPICTLKNYPHKIEHTIQWARDLFEGDFKQAAEEVNNYIQQPNYMQSLKAQQNTILLTLQTLKSRLVDQRPGTFDDCILWACDKFNEEYNIKIRQLLATFPYDALTSEGTPFWSGTKRAPTPLTLDGDDPVHLEFIKAAAVLYGYTFHINCQNYINNDNYIRQVILEKYTPKEVTISKIKVATTEEEAKELENSMHDGLDVDHEVAKITAELPPPNTLAGFKMAPVEFEKDDDSNYHIAFITACSNLRARNYQIKEESAHMTKFIAGKIIPAIATTTALVTGLVCLELLKIVQNKPLDAYRNTFVTLATNMLASSEPATPATQTTVFPNGVEYKWSQWDFIEVALNDGNDIPTLQQLLDDVGGRYGATATTVLYGSTILYLDFMMDAETTKRLDMKITDVITEVTQQPIPDNLYFIKFEMTLEDDDGEDLPIPTVRLRIKQ